MGVLLAGWPTGVRTVGVTELTLVTPPALEPVTLDEVRSYLQLPDDLVDQDDNLEVWITEARQAVERVSDRALISQVWDYAIDRFPSAREIRLPLAPVLSVTAVTAYTDAAVATVLDAGAYVAGVGEIGRIVLRDAGSWPTDVRACRAGVIRFTAGYGTTAVSVPEPLRQQIKTLVKRRYDGLDTAAIAWDDISSYLPVTLA
jgi:uncharacterized phiE125 gp8 family phage protein